METTEIWKPVADLKWGHLYDVSNQGRVRRSLFTEAHDGTFPGRLLKGVRLKGYLVVHLSDHDRRQMLRVHRLVAGAFVPNPRQLPFVNHIDAVKIHNAASNLEWCTTLYNNAHRDWMGLQVRGIDVHTAKLDEEKVLVIRELYRKGVFQKKIAAQFGVSQSLISVITRNAAWKHVTSNYEGGNSTSGTPLLQ